MSWLSDRLKRSKKKKTGIYSWLPALGKGKGTALGTAVGSIVPGVGNVIGASVGGAFDAFANKGHEKAEAEARKNKEIIAEGKTTEWQKGNMLPLAIIGYLVYCCL